MAKEVEGSALYQAYPDNTLEQILSQFRAFCLPEFLLEGHISRKIFSESISNAKRHQLMHSLRNLSQVHQTFSASNNETYENEKKI